MFLWVIEEFLVRVSKTLIWEFGGFLFLRFLGVVGPVLDYNITRLSESSDYCGSFRYFFAL